MMVCVWLVATAWLRDDGSRKDTVVQRVGSSDGIVPRITGRIGTEITVLYHGQ